MKKRRTRREKDEVEVRVASYGKGRCLMMVYIDPESGKKVARTSGTTDERQARQAATRWELELRENRYIKRQILWADFTVQYIEEGLHGRKPKTVSQLGTVFNTAERLVKVERLADLNENKLRHIAKTLRAEGKSDFTVRNYLAHLRASLVWAVDQKLLAAVPKFPRITGLKSAAGKSMKGRPITGEEFDRMLVAVPKAVLGDGGKKTEKIKKGERTPEQREQDAATVESWRFYLRGLWLSGLRLRESLNLFWEERPGRLSVDLSGRYPMLKIPGEAQKNGKDQLYPVAPDFGEFLLSIPKAERRGRVFRPLGTVNPFGGPATVAPIRDADWVSRIVTRIGERAGVKVSSGQKRDAKTGKSRDVVKWASAHDLRRAFGFRWSRRIMPAELRELMRHADIQTTMAFYVGQCAAATAERLWASYRAESGSGNTSGNSQLYQGGAEGESAGQETTQPVVLQRVAKYTSQDSNL